MDTATEAATRHHAIVHAQSYQRQPQKAEMAKITNDMKKTYSEQLPLSTILQYFGNGQCVILSDTDVDAQNNLCFVSTKLFAIDVDDDDEQTDVREVASMLEGKLAGLFYTFSHGIKGNRYRLVFQLDQVVTDENSLKGIAQVMANELIDMGIPADKQALNPRLPIRGGKRAEMIDAQSFIRTEEYLQKAKQAAEEIIHTVQTNTKAGSSEPIPFSELERMVEAIGPLPHGQDEQTSATWKKIVYAIKSYTLSGHITEEEGLQLFDTISGGEAKLNQWNAIKNPFANIGALINEAKRHGFTFRKSAFSQYKPIENSYETGTIQTRGKLTPEDIAPLLERESWILLDSPTGSGKTANTMKAFQQTASTQPHFYIFASPYVTTTEQVASIHNCRAIRGETERLFKNLYADAKKGVRTFVSTYDQVPNTIRTLRNAYPGMTFTIAIDEYHKVVTEYDYRFRAIRGMLDTAESADTVLALSGTVTDINKNDFDEVISVHTGTHTSPCQEFMVYTFRKRNKAIAELVELLETWVTSKTHGRRMLVFLQSKEKIQQVKKSLQYKGIKVRALNASDKRNPTYRSIVEKEVIEDEVDVVLTTNVIADGVNIFNELDWETLVVSDPQLSPMFNASTIKQMSNRFRNPYRRFSVFIHEPKEEEIKPFHIEGAYRFRLDIARRITDAINTSINYQKELFHEGPIERNYGVYQTASGRITFCKDRNRFLAAQTKEFYYRQQRNAFIAEVEKELRMKKQGTVDVSKEIEEKRLAEMLETQAVIEEAEAELQQTEDEKKQNILHTFTPKVYHAFRDEDEGTLKAFKRQAAGIHYSCLSKVSSILSFEACQNVVSTVNGRVDTHKAYQALDRFVEGAYLLQVHRPSKSREALLLALNLGEGKYLESKTFAKQEKEIAKKIKVQQKDIREVLKMANIEQTRTKHERKKRVAGFKGVRVIAEENNLTHAQVIEGLINLARRKGQTYETATKAQIRKEGFHV